MVYNHLIIDQNAFSLRRFYVATLVLVFLNNSVFFVVESYEYFYSQGVVPYSRSRFLWIKIFTKNI